DEGGLTDERLLVVLERHQRLPQLGAHDVRGERLHALRRGALGRDDGLHVAVGEELDAVEDPPRLPRAVVVRLLGLVVVRARGGRRAGGGGRARRVRGGRGRRGGVSGVRRGRRRRRRRRGGRGRRRVLGLAQVRGHRAARLLEAQAAERVPDRQDQR